MRLKRIKLSGFKSFVEPISVPLPGNLVGVVGPNGCGKSNIIDAIRWVMGESSPRNLRGDNMADVIFSGSSARKPLGRAMVELIFDNTDGGAGGPYAGFAEIAIRREVSRDGLSDYSINKTRCRRKDITTLLLGTGLGPRNYSIIEQGMVSRIIEGKPEDLRLFVEEVAGISKYRERRKETESRMRHTRENLERVDDLRRELDTQLNRLKRQSRAAERYKVLRAEEHSLRARLHALRWRDLKKTIAGQERTIAEQETALEGQRAEQTAIDRKIEEQRQQRTQASDGFNKVQGEFYALGADIAGVEQSIEHNRDTRERQARELGKLETTIEDLSRQGEQDRARQQRLRQELAGIGPATDRCRAEFESARAALSGIEEKEEDWRERFESLRGELDGLVREQEVQSGRGQEIGRQAKETRLRIERLEDEAQELRGVLGGAGLSELAAQAQQSDAARRQDEEVLGGIVSRIRECREQIETANQALLEISEKYQRAQARQQSLEELQAEIAGQGEAAENWLRERGLEQAPMLRDQLEVESGWERAVERALGNLLAGRCVGSLGESEGLGELAGGVSLVEASRGAAARGGELQALAGKLRRGGDEYAELLSGTWCTGSLAQALAVRERLASGERIVTRDGVLVGRHWISRAETGESAQGMLERATEIRQLGARVAELSAAMQGQRQLLEETRQRLLSLEDERDSRQRRLSTVSAEHTELQNRLGGQQARLEELENRLRQVDNEKRDLARGLEQQEQEQAQAQARTREAASQAEQRAARKQALDEERAKLQAQLEEARQAEHAARDSLHEQELAHQGLAHGIKASEEGLARIQQQLTSMEQQKRELSQALQGGDGPEQELKEKLAGLLRQRIAVEERLAKARTAVEAVDEEIRAHEQKRNEQEKRVEESRVRLEEERGTRREMLVRLETISDQLKGLDTTAEAVLAELPEGTTDASLVTELEGVERRISRIGPVNLVAIEEFEEQSERKSYLDAQNEDLAGALTTLENAIRRIDRETRTRFRETFDAVNKGFQEYFPRLFGGGHAQLALTEDDVLTAGVTVTARPPGKRNTTIHLLSGGEKALTAVSLLFSFFTLNPAPFCLLDEVDAPLDDANVARFCETLRVLSERSQMIFITHNKITMETADHLIGVTMGEPGVSRLVAVDVLQAVEMAAQ
ncbi:MAG: chromosome segregation protein SMC [Gammaproteobacteria bacterium]|nr:chromosome segregation protein SMC [Gammaproteobacteria bacterium]